MLMTGKHTQSYLSMRNPKQAQRSSLLTDFVRDIWLPLIKTRKASWQVDERIAKKHILPALGGKHLNEIDKDTVLHWLQSFDRQDCALTTRNRRLDVLKSICNLAVEKGYLSEAPTYHVPSVRVEKKEGPSLNYDKFSTLLERLKQSDRKEAKAIALLLVTGARKSEILTARWENLFPEERVLLVPERIQSRCRKIWLSAEALHIVHSIPRHRGSPWIFPGRDVKRPMSDVFLFWKELRAEFGLNTLRICDLRHVFAEWQLKSGTSPAVLQRCLGIVDMRQFNRHILHNLPSPI